MPTIGAWFNEQNHCQWRVWAPRATTVDLILGEDRGATTRRPMKSEPSGYFSLVLPDIPEGQRYSIASDGSRGFPDPASRWQPEGVHGASAVWSPATFPWTDSQWRGVAHRDLVIYELHVGTFTSEGTFAAIIPRLGELKSLGVTAIEIMPVGQFPGQFGWGYDGVYWYAVQQSYGGPREFQRLVNACHEAGLAVILDVIYNHLGPEGNYLAQFGPYFESRHGTPWGSAVNYDGPDSEGVRNFVLENVRYWIDHFHVDGLRLDAVQEIYDDGTPHLLAEIAATAHERADRRGWPAHVIAETDQNDVRIVTPVRDGGYGVDAMWNDEFHHCIHVLFTGEQDGYYRDFPQPVQQLRKVWNDVFAYDGGFSVVRRRPHGTSAAGIRGRHFVVSIQTHDQVGNRAVGDRLHTQTTPAQQRLAAGLLLTSPFTPMLFMGEEYGEQRPFPFFCDFGDEHLRDAVREGRRKEFASFDWNHNLPDPVLPATRDSAVLTWSWPIDTHQARLRQLYRDLLKFRKDTFQFPDDVDRHATLIETDRQTHLLVVRRGAVAAGLRSVVIVFHLGNTVASKSVADVAQRELFLSSEAGAYTGSGEPPPAEEIWQPWEFRIYTN